MKKILLCILLLTAISMAGQPASHVWFGAKVWNNTPQNLLWARPVAVMGSHIIIDRFIGETGLGEYQVDIAAVRLLIMYFTTPEEERKEFLEIAFWSMLPDLIDKGFNTRYFHSGDGSTIFNLSHDQTELFEELVILDYTVEF